MESSIWYEKYKPTKIDDLIIPSEMRGKFNDYLANQTLPNLGLWSLMPGLGKTSTAHAIIKQLGCDALWINASLERGIDVIRSKIKCFAERASFDGSLKIVVLDECDHLTQDTMAAFRGFLDEFSTSCRFIFTGNYKNKIIQPLLDRLENYDYLDFDKREIITQVAQKCVFILKSK